MAESSVFNLSRPDSPLHEMLNHAPVAICHLKGEDMIVEMINDEVCRIWGLNREDIIGKALFSLRPSAKRSGFDKILLKVFKTGEPFSGLGMSSSLERFGRTDEIFCNYHASASRNVEGEITGLITYATDVTEEIISKKNLQATVKERQEANLQMQDLNQEFKFVMDFMPQMLWATQPDGYSFYYNKGWLDYTGLSLEENVGFGWTQTLHPDDYTQAVETWKSALESGSLYEIEYRIRRHDGVYRWFLGRGQPMKDHQGKIIKWYGSSTDINEQKKALQDKDEFLGVLSHELKTPVTSLKAFCEFQENKFQENGDEDSAHILAKMDAQINKLTNLIGDLLDVSSLTAGKLKFHEEDFVLDALILEVVEEMKRTTKRHELIIVGHENYSVFGDRERIGQVITNLLSNAIKYSADSEKIVIKTESHNQQIVFSVQDNGIGIHPDRQKHVFDRFFRISEGKMNSYPGLGLGLYISSEIVQRHGGTIWLKSSEGKGSIFSFSLPLYINA